MQKPQRNRELAQREQRKPLHSSVFSVLHFSSRSSAVSAFLNSVAKRKILALFLTFVLAGVACFLFLPSQLFKKPTCTIVKDRKGVLLAAKIAGDGQWQFPERNTVPDKFKTAIIYFEDEYFDYHPGINPVSFARAMKQNIAAGKVVSGGSTISMQVIRLSRNGKSRTVFEKLIEIVLATRMELRFSKEEILAMYASHAPFGGNVVGLDAAAWRYYGREPEKLSWGEAATLAVLPNAPSLIFPGKNQEQLRTKRNVLLNKLEKKGVIDATTCDLAKAEPLPGLPQALPQLTPHLLARLSKEGYSDKEITTTIDARLQQKANDLADKYHKALSQNDIHNLAILVMKVETGEVLTYVGNAPCDHKETGADVDVIPAPRSTGSILKPLLYAAMLDDSELLPDALVADIPTHFSGYAPKNFDKTYDGAVPASNALTRSLNVPAVRMLRQFGLERFHDMLQQLGLSAINKSANHYGLTLILGGAEASLWDIVSVYGSMARSLNHFGNFSGRYFPGDYKKASFFRQEEYKPNLKELKQRSLFDAASIWQTFEVLSNVNRPREERGWENFASSRKVAWKTGTSFGHRDAWAVGITPEYVVGVWVGNATGEGRPGLVGTMVAGPILFETFKLLPSTSWFEPPWDELRSAAICSWSGYRASVNCDKIDTLWIPEKGLKTQVCPFHQIIHLDNIEKHRVTSGCYAAAEMVNKPWFVLPPAQEWYYKNKDPQYKPLPPFASGCMLANSKNMEIIYPEENAKIFIPLLMDGNKSKAVFEAVHHNPGTNIYWHVDDEYMGSTTNFAKLELTPSEGLHKLTLVDDHGEEVTQWFEVVGRGE